MDRNDKITPRESFDKKRLPVFCVKGRSMLPFLQEGDMLVVEHREASGFSPGDIIIYRDVFQNRIVHRIIWKSLKRGRVVFLTKGDNSATAIVRVYPEQITGKVISFNRGGREIEINDSPKRTKIIFYAFYAAMGNFILSFSGNIVYMFRHKILGGVARALQRLKIYGPLGLKFTGAAKARYRPVTAADSLSLERFYINYYWPVRLKIINELSDASFYAGRNCFLAEIRGRIVGSVFIGRPAGGEELSGECRVFGFFVDWRYRNIGIENELIKLFISEVEKLNVDMVNILVPKNDYFSSGLFQGLCGLPASSEYDAGINIFPWKLR